MLKLNGIKGLRALSPASQQAIVVCVAAVIYLTGLISPPHLMDDVDAAESLQAKNMLLSGDWVTQHLNGTRYLDKAPLKYWLTASLYSILGIHDWVARIPTALAAILLCWLVVRMAGFYSGLVLSTSIGLFLFTRTVIPDVILTLFITLSLWCFMQCLESERSSRSWALGMYSAMACAVLAKGLIGLVFPVAIGLVYMLFTRNLAWRKLHPAPGILLLLVIAAPWHILATLHNPPVLDFTLHPGPHFGGKFRGFFWFYFINEQLLRFLNQRWPRDYNTVPRIWFWLYHIIWFFPWSLYFPAIAKLSFKPVDPAGRLRILALCWIGVVMLFFTFSTTQEYYSMPIYPAIAILLGSAMKTTANTWESKTAGIISLVTAIIMTVILVKVWSLPTPGDIYAALAQHPDLYTLSLGHMADLTLSAFAYLRLPLGIAALALFIGGVMMVRQCAYITTALMLVLLFQAARIALIAFDPYLSSHAIAERLNHLPQGTLVICGKYNPLSSIFFYSHDQALQNEPDLDILEYGSLAPDAPRIAISDADLKHLWSSPARVYLVAKAPKLQHLENLLHPRQSQLLLQSGDKYLFANQAIR